MNDIQIFKHEQFGSIRSVAINDEPWFVGKDVAEVLGYADAFGALKKHVDDEDKQNCQNDSFESNRGMTIINESGLYSLVLSSKLPSAKQFKRWVTSEVLPSLRKNGAYIAAKEDDTDMDIMARGLMAAQRMIEQRDAKIKMLTPKAEYADECLLATNGITVSSIAKEYGMSAIKLNGLLKGLGIQFKQNKQWLLYSKYQDKGYTVTRTTLYNHSDGKADMRRETLWTMKGRKLIYDKLATLGIYPQTEMTGT